MFLAEPACVPEWQEKVLRIEGDGYVCGKRIFGGTEMKANWKNGVLYALLFGFCFCGGRLAAKQDAIAASADEHPRLAILIDDFGYHGEGTEEMLSLPVAFSAAVMPFSDCTEEDAARIRQAGKEILIHMPMESLTGKREWVGKKGVFREMTDGEIRAATAEAFAILPDAVGMNNHMGSAIMEDERCLSAVMGVLGEKGCFFVDSMTTADSCGESVAEANGVCILGRDVFLDSTKDVEQVKANLRKAAEIAGKNGSAVAIGHVGPEGGKTTAEAIAALIPELEDAGIEFVTVGELAK